MDHEREKKGRHEEVNDGDTSPDPNGETRGHGAPANDTFDEKDAAANEESHNQEADDNREVATKRAPKKRRVIVGNKADLYSHFQTLSEKAFTKGGKDLGLYLCICKYCQTAYDKAKASWLELSDQERSATSEPVAPQPFPRTRRYCINHQKQCPHVPTDTALAVVGGTLTNPPKLRTFQASPSEDSPATVTERVAGAQRISSEVPIYGFIQPATFEVFVAKDTFKFNAAHFVAFEGYRERLHGHNYTMSVRLQGAPTYIGPDGYVIDYGNIKKVCKEICKELNEHFLCPSYSDVLKISHLARRQVIRIDCPMDGTYFEFPTQDCKILPIVHATTEELAIYLWSRVMERLDADFLRQRGIGSMELTVAEAPGQQATFRYPVQAEKLDVRTFVKKGAIVPAPCIGQKPRQDTTATQPVVHDSAECAQECEACTGGIWNGGKNASSRPRFSTGALESLTKAMKAQGLLVRDVTSSELQSLLGSQEDE